MLFMYVTLEVSKLSGWLNAFAFCRESKGGHAVRCGVRAGTREVAGNRGARSVQGRARLQIRGRAWRGAHPEHAEHACDAGGVEAQRLVERQRVLPRVERRAYTMRSDDGRFLKYTTDRSSTLTTHKVRPALFLGRRSVKSKPPCVGLVWPLWSHSPLVLPPPRDSALSTPTPLRSARLADSTVDSTLNSTPHKVRTSPVPLTALGHHGGPET